MTYFKKCTKLAIIATGAMLLQSTTAQAATLETYIKYTVLPAYEKFSAKYSVGSICQQSFATHNEYDLLRLPPGTRVATAFKVSLRGFGPPVPLGEVTGVVTTKEKLTDARLTSAVANAGVRACDDFMLFSTPPFPDAEGAPNYSFPF